MHFKTTPHALGSSRRVVSQQQVVGAPVAEGFVTEIPPSGGAMSLGIADTGDHRLVRESREPQHDVGFGDRLPTGVVNLVGHVEDGALHVKPIAHTQIDALKQANGALETRLARLEALLEKQGSGLKPVSGSIKESN